MNSSRKIHSNARIDMDKLVSPDSFYWPGYIWFWQDRLSEDAITSQLEDMVLHGARSVWTFPWPNFRPEFNPTSMEPEYLSPEFLQLYRHTIEEASRLGMRVWLYDEGGWPSGGVCGRIVRDDPSLARQYVERTELNAAKGRHVEIPQDCLSAFLYQGDSMVRQLVPGTGEDIDIEDARVVVFSVGRITGEILYGMPYPDLLNPKSTREFISRTHETYKEAVGEYFGDAIPLIFTDEPMVNAHPWTDDLAADFQRTKGYDLRSHLPATFEPDASEGMQVRVDCYDWWSKRYSEAFFGQIQDWCRENNIFFAGHLGGEDDTLGPIKHGFGHVLRMLRRFDIPGVDAIWRQIFPGGEHTIKHHWASEVTDITVGKNHHFPKYASSVAHQEGRPWALTESFAVYGAGLTPEQMKWITDFQYVRGINLMTMAGYPLSTRDYYMAGQRPVAGKGNPLWRYMSAYHEYTARLSYLLSLGKAAVDVAVYYPVRDVWAGGPDVQKVADSNDMLARLLLENQCDFDFVDDDLLERESSVVADGALHVGAMKYRTIFVSRTAWITDSSKKKLSQFASSGGKLMWVDSGDVESSPAEGLSIGFDELPQRVEPLVKVDRPEKWIRVCKRALENGNLYFVTNEHTAEVTRTLHFDERLPILRVDPETGHCWKPEGAVLSKTGWSVTLSIEYAGSRVFFFTDEAMASTPAPPLDSVVLSTLNTGWSIRKVRSYLIGEHDFELYDYADDQPVGVELGDWQPVLGNDFSGDVEYHVIFDVAAETAQTATTLDLGDVRYACELILNGVDLGKCIWRPYAFPIPGILHEGRNELRVTVTNTMANQFVTTRLLDRWPDKVIGPYHKTALGIEPDSMPSGLYGPVTIFARRRTGSTLEGRGG